MTIDQISPKNKFFKNTLFTLKDITHNDYEKVKTCTSTEFEACEKVASVLVRALLWILKMWH